VAIAMINSLGNLSGLVGPTVLGKFKDLTGSTSTGLLIMSVFLIAGPALVFVMCTWTDQVTGGLSHNKSLASVVRSDSRRSPAGSEVS
jgi:nitrate/nitrite transporter NarK